MCVRVSDPSETQPQLEVEFTAFMFARDETSRVQEEREGRSGGDGSGKGEAYLPRPAARLVATTAIRDRTKGRDEPVVALRPLVVLRHPDVARRVGLEPGSPGLAAAERFLERQGYIKSVTVGTEVGAFAVTDAGRTWLEQERWASLWWRSVFG